MNQEILDDLKRFIGNTVSQTETRLREHLVSKADVTGREARLTKQMRDGFAAVGDVFETHIKDEDEQFADYQHQLDQLKKAAP
jgi:hypothetical protein